MITPKEFKDAYEKASNSMKNVSINFLKTGNYDEEKEINKFHITGFMNGIYIEVSKFFPDLYLGFEYQKDGSKKRIDAFLYKDSDNGLLLNNSKVKVAIEHHNDIYSLHKPINRLVEFNLPSVLNVIITHCTEHPRRYQIIEKNETINKINGTLMFILSPDDKWMHHYETPNNLKWEYHIYDKEKNDLIKI